MVGGAWGDSHEFGLRPADLHPHKVGFFMKCFTRFEINTVGLYVNLIVKCERLFTKIHIA